MFVFKGGSLEPKPKVVHFVNGAFTGSTAVAISLCESCSDYESILILNQKRPSNIQAIEALRAKGFKVHVLVGRNRPIGTLKLAKTLRILKPDILVCHGNSEHIWGRYAGILSGVKILVHVEHNSKENYKPFRIKELNWLANRTCRTIACSEAVKSRLISLGLQDHKIETIENGIELDRFRLAGDDPLHERQLDIIMPARFVRQKDQLTLIRALAIVKEQGVKLSLTLAGGGDSLLRKICEEEAEKLGLEDAVTFTGHVNNLPELLMKHRYCVLSSQYEGYPLVLCEAMAAQCLVIGSRVSGIEGFIRESVDGLLFDAGDPNSLADKLIWATKHGAPAYEMARAGNTRANEQFGVQRMRERYRAVFDTLLNPTETTEQR